MIDSYIEQYGKRLYGLCLTLCKNKDFADELYQETWLRVLKKIDSYNETKPFENWLTRICVNLYRDMYRKNKKFDFVSSENTEYVNLKAEEKEDYSSLRTAIKSLPEKFKTTVILHYYSDLDEKKTAEMLGIPLGTVKSRLSKAKQLLRKELEDEYITF